MKKAALHNLGCKVNAYETQAMQQMLEEAGYEIVSFQESADVYVINTCSVTNIADRKSRQMLSRARRRNPRAVIVAAGCYVQTGEQQILNQGIADIIIGNNKKKLLASMLAAYEQETQPQKAVDREDIQFGKKEYEPLFLTKTAGHTRAFIKVQDGCSQFCSYCVIPYARGRARSRKEEDVLAEIRALAEGGYKEAVLTGIHLASYGLDTGASLLGLIAKVHEIEGIERIRLGSLEPGIVTEAFVSALAAFEKVCPHFHLSLQSGCDATLKRMNRRYDTACYRECCEVLRRHFSYPAITTDVITGFPGETEEEFQTTERFLEQIQFYEMHVFKYSARDGTKAAVMPGQIAEEVKARRSARLAALSERMSAQYRMGLCGRKAEVLLEEPFVYNGMQYYTGYTKEYVKAAVQPQENRAGSTAYGKITGQLTQDIYLMVEF